MTPEEQAAQQAHFQREMKLARARNRAHRRALGQKSGQSPFAVKPAPTPEHYHILYNVPKADVAIPHWAELFTDLKDLYIRMKEMGDASEPNTEWYDDGRVGIETTLHGRTGLWWIVLEPARCVRTQCRAPLARMQQKKRLVLLPGTNPKKPVFLEASDE
jgi:hypothetical protein